jgi:hypothetical protein
MRTTIKITNQHNKSSNKSILGKKQPNCLVDVPEAENTNHHYEGYITGEKYGKDNPPRCKHEKRPKID